MFLALATVFGILPVVNDVSFVEDDDEWQFRFVKDRTGIQHVRHESHRVRRSETVDKIYSYYFSKIT